MWTRWGRLMPLAGIAAVILWIAGLAIWQGAGSLPGDPTNDQILAWDRDNANAILSGGWLFVLGCLCFIAYMAVLRSRWADREGGRAPLSTAMFAGGVAVAVTALLSPGGDMASAIDKDSVSASTAAAMHELNSAFFVATELLAIVFVLAAAILALRAAVVPRLWAFYGFVLAVVLVIGPIGWVGVIFGVPIWIIGTTVFLLRTSGAAERLASEPETAAAL